jgi:hypothetical protein
MSEDQPAKVSDEQANDEVAMGKPAKATTGRTLLGLVFALLGGGITWLVLLQTYPIFLAGAGGVGSGMPSAPSEDFVAEQRALSAAVDVKNALVFVTILGAAVGITMALARAMVTKSWKVAVFGAITCGLCGALLGALGSYLGYTAKGYLVTNEAIPPSVSTVIAQAVMLGLLGAGVGLGLGLTRTGGKALTVATYGLLAGVLAGILYPILAVGILPACNIDLLVPNKSYSQLLWTALSSGLIGLLVANAMDANG